GLVCLLGACLFPEDAEVVAAMGDQGAGLLPVPAAPPQEATDAGESAPPAPGPGQGDGTAGSNASPAPSRPEPASGAGAVSEADDGPRRPGPRATSGGVATRGGGGLFLVSVALVFCRRSRAPRRRYSAARALSGGKSE